VACSPDNHPARLPIGLRVASTITGLPMLVRLEHVSLL
jgi:hypothetical protein